MTRDEAVTASTLIDIAVAGEIGHSANVARNVLIEAEYPVSRASVPHFVEHLQRGAKPAHHWRCGIELEVFGYDAQHAFARLDAAQVQSTLARLASPADQVAFEAGALVEVNAGEQHGRITVEPGGQIEFSGAPERSLYTVEREAKRHLAKMSEIARECGYIFLAAGFDPLRTIEEQHWFPKSRYGVMRPFLAARGGRAWDMMCRTCAVQINLDYEGPEDLAKKFILGNRLSPIITAIFANSPFENGKLSGYKSTRAAAWMETDAERTGLSPLALTDDFSPAAFVAYALNIPMIFVRRNERCLELPANLKFSDFLDHGYAQITPRFGDWIEHLTTIFTDARLKQHLEMRSADCNNLALAMALAALWKGLMYERSALDEALHLMPKLKHWDALELRRAVARDGLAAYAPGVRVLDIAKQLVELAFEGLQRIAAEETRYLEILREMVIEDEICPADILLRNYHGAWHGSMSRVLDYLRIA